MGGVFNLGMAMEGHCSCFKKLAPDDDENCESGLMHVLIFLPLLSPPNSETVEQLGESNLKRSPLDEINLKDFCNLSPVSSENRRSQII